MRQCFRVILPLVGLKLFVLATTIFLLHRAERAPVLCAWDCVHYKEIAERGYSFTEGKQGTMAFFPVFPTLVGWLSQLTGTAFEKTGIALNVGLFGLFSWLFMLWGRNVGLSRPWVPPVLLAIDRHSFWSHIPYTEPLFAVILLGFLLLQRTTHPTITTPALVAFLAGLASGTRLVGVSLVAGLGLGNLRYYLRRPHLGLLTLVVGLWGMLAYFGYLQIAHGSWKLSFITTSAWNRYHSFPGLFESIRILFARMYFPTVIILVTSIWALIKPPAGLKFTSTERVTFAFLLYIPLANSVQLGLTRYLTVVLPGYILLAFALDKALGSSRFRGAPAWARMAVWAILGSIAAGEIYWQVMLTRKFFLNEAFFWAA